MPFDHLGLDVGAGVPQSDGAIVGGAGEDVLVGRKGDAGYLFGVSVEGEVALGVINVPEVDVVVGPRRGDVLAEVGRKVQVVAEGSGGDLFLGGEGLQEPGLFLHARTFKYCNEVYY